MSSTVYAHFIGIGGAGMSGIARVLHDRGVVVTGSDLRESRYSHALREAGIPVAIGHAATNLGKPEVVVVSSAIPDSNPELVEARKRELPIWPRAKMLAHLAGDRRTIAVAGTHGKTTTSSMVATMLAGLELDPTYLIGGEVCGFGTNAACGAGDYYVVEADESDGSFLYLDPTVSVITNVEADHLDHYGTLAAVEEIFEEFAARTAPDGSVVVCADDDRAMAVAQSSGARMVTYGCSAAADVRCDDLRPTGTGHSFTVTLPGGVSCAASIMVPGTHNVLNATACLAVAYALGLDVAGAAGALAGFAGVKRRFDEVGVAGGVRVIDDYAHHPTEVRATLAAARAVGAARVSVVFQPHRYSRTAALATEFGAAFGDADRVILMEVYSAGETPIPGVTGKTLVEELLLRDPRARVTYLPHRSDIPAYLALSSREGDLVITMGAGDVTALGPEILRALTDEMEVTR
ncbi:MAG: UDP-N-acetylmuramate--L-alanine ligase [Anaerosomatales bacterium]|nr:UDP-N-acetylmuramate--L-alanine ligase [Anaerosomatales bacterium]MDT8433250.1 UDP-N-acetylmuramate--L-alanine ligase [Anaerosomatales bacterium]